MNFASYASFSNLSKGRRYELHSLDIRDCFERDRDRVIHSLSFRKLGHKTQVFMHYDGDCCMTRLTHSLEVAQIARSISRALRVNEDLAECIALSHDLGHPPFGHVGEEALSSSTFNLVKFEHNVQTIRILIDLEERYHGFNGLNLSWETLEGLVKHNGPINNPGFLMKEYDSQYQFNLNLFPSLEAQIASIADDIAYNAHDLDDGLGSCVLSIKQIENVAPIGRLFYEIREKFVGINDNLLLKEALRRLIAYCIADVILEVENNIKALNIQTSDDVKNSLIKVVCFSSDAEKILNEIKAFLMENLYRDYRVLAARNRAYEIVKDLFHIFWNNNDMLPRNWRIKVDNVDDFEKSIIICDYISGMTDRFAVKEHMRLFDTYAFFESNY